MKKYQMFLGYALPYKSFEYVKLDKIIEAEDPGDAEMITWDLLEDNLKDGDELPHKLDCEEIEQDEIEPQECDCLGLGCNDCLGVGY